MQSLFISETASLVRGGKTSNTDVAEAQNANLIPYNDRILGMIKVLADVPETLHPPRVHRYNIDPDGLQDNGSLRTMFNGRNAIAQGGNPVIDFSTGAWSTPLDSYVNDAVRWIETTTPGNLFVGKKYRIESVGTTDFTTIGASANTVGEIFTATATTSGSGTVYQVSQSGDFVVGCWYEIDTVGTTDFTTIGASANTVGVMFQATGTTPGGTGVAIATKGARHGDMAGNTYDDGVNPVKQQLWVNVYDYNNSSGNQLALIESEDGFVNYTEVGEIQFGGGNFGSTVADVIQRPGTTDLYMLCGAAHGSRGYYKITRKSTDGGTTWTDTGSEIPLSDDPSSPRYYGLPVGRFIWSDATSVWVSVPASLRVPDAPEINFIATATWAELDAGSDWTIWDKAPSVLRGPQYSGVWNVDYCWRSDGVGIAACNSFGMQSFDDINTSTMNTLRDNNQYFRMGADSNKHTTVVRSINRLAIDDPTYWPFTNGATVQFAHFGKYLKAESTDSGANLTFTEDSSNTLTNFVARKEGEFFWRFDLEDDPTLSIATGGAGHYANNRAVGLPFELRTHDQADPTENYEHHFAVKLVGDENPTQCYLVNRRSSLVLSDEASQKPLLEGNSSALFSIISSETPVEIWNITSRVTDLENDVSVLESAVFDTRTQAAAATIPNTVNYVKVFSYSDDTPEAEAVYKRSASYSLGSFQSADGTHWVPDWEITRVQMVGGIGDGVTDDQNACYIAHTLGKPIFLDEGLEFLATDFNNTLGVEVYGPGRIIEAVDGGFLQKNSSRDIGPVYYRNHLFSVKSLWQSGGLAKIVIFGDSTATNNYGLTIDTAVKATLQDMGLGVEEVINEAVGGTSWNTEDYSLTLDGYGEQKDLAIFKFGINEAGSPDTSTIEEAKTSLRNSLGTRLSQIRASTYGGVDDLSILLLMPNCLGNSSLNDSNKNNLWLEEIRGVYLHYALEHHCAVYDPYQESRNAHGGENRWMDANLVHPQVNYNLDIWGRSLREMFMPLCGTSRNRFLNLSNTESYAIASDGVGSYPYGTSFQRTSSGDGWPISGVVITERQRDNIAKQTIFSYQLSYAVQKVRYWVISTNSWSDWSGVSRLITMATGFEKYNTTLGDPLVRRTPEGLVTLHGVAKLTAGTGVPLANGTLIGTLPSGFRPTSQLRLHCLNRLDHGSNYAGILLLETNGQLKAELNVIDTYIGLDGGQFWTTT